MALPEESAHALNDLAKTDPAVEKFLGVCLTVIAGQISDDTMDPNVSWHDDEQGKCEAFFRKTTADKLAHVSTAMRELSLKFRDL